MTSLGGGSPADTVLRVLRVALHLAFAGLLLLALVQMGLSRPPLPLLCAAYLLAAVLAGVYLAGTVAEKRFAASGRGPDPGRWARVWLAAVTVLWLALLLISVEFSWLAFPLFFLDLHLLRRGPALAAVTATTLAVIAAQWAAAGSLSLPLVLGPLIGALFAVVMGFAYSSLHIESVNQRRALEELRRTRGELAASQREFGVLAERGRLAREIHDTLAQGFSSIVLISRAADSALAAGNTDLARERLRTVQATAAENLAEARRFVTGLSADAGGALLANLERLCADARQTAGASGKPVEFSLRVDGEPGPVEPETEAALLRAAQASVANVLSHARASRAVLTLGWTPDAVTLDVYDDGRGFDPAALPREPRPDGSGFGLLGLRSRVLGLHGSFAVESAPGEGTVVAVRIPRRRSETAAGQEDRQ